MLQILIQRLQVATFARYCSAHLLNNFCPAEEQLLALFLDLFQAGTETTSNTLAFGIIHMLHNEPVQQKLRLELDSIIGRDRLPNLNDRSQLVYTEAVICEIQRISNVAPLGIAHRCTDTVKFRGYIIPKDTMALVSLYSLHMDEQYWKDPFTFRPDRFIDECGQFVQHEYFLPFGLGKWPEYDLRAIRNYKLWFLYILMYRQKTVYGRTFGQIQPIFVLCVVYALILYQCTTRL